MTQNHQIPSSAAPYWSSSTKYQPVLPLTDPVPSCINQFCSQLIQYHHASTKYCLLTQYHHISYSNVRLSFVELRLAQLYVCLVLSCYYWFTLEPNWERQITRTSGSFQGGNEYDWKCQNVRSFETSLGTTRTCSASTSPTLTGKRASRSELSKDL